MEGSNKRKSQHASNNSSKQQRLDIEEFDEQLQNFAPREVNIQKYVESHAEEIQYFTKKLQVEPCGKKISQKLPIHMRRRAMAHDVRRLPRSVRHMALTGEPAPKKNKRPSRKHRRRPKNLLAEYTRRQRKHVWLETHVWHAKRFHMIEKWGCKLPWKPTAKRERACYRAAARYCMIQDMSYLCCIELIGEQDTLLDGLSHLTSKDTGQTFAAVSCLPGTREGHTMLYRFDNYPRNAIGPVDFMWNPAQPIVKGEKFKPTNQRQLWIWCHPACFIEVWNEISQCFELTEQNLSSPSALPPMSGSKIQEKGDSEKCTDKALEDSNSSNKEFNVGTFAVRDNFKAGVTAINKERSVMMTSLSGSLLRLRLTGPESNAVLVDTLHKSVVEPNKDIMPTWWSKFYKIENAATAYQAQCSYMEKVGQCMSPAELPPHCIVAMTTRDPRISRPLKRERVSPEETNISSAISVCREKLEPQLSMSPLWQSDVREQVTTTKMTDHQLHQLKSDCLVPSLDVEQTDEESRVPVIIIQRPGTSNSTHCPTANTRPGWGSGFDILLPKGWAMPFWLALVYRGARCGGLKELEGVASEGKSLLFPNMFPDTLAGQMFEIGQEKELVDKYNRMPPAKRPNYTKLNVMSPFRCPWDALVRDQEDAMVANEVQDVGNASKTTAGGAGTENIDTRSKETIGQSKEIPFSVVRSAKIVRKLQKCFEPEKRSKLNCKATGTNNDISVIVNSELDNTLVSVKLEMVHRGTPTKFAHVCIPTNEDIAKLDNDKNYGGPLEPLQQDVALIERKVVKRELKKKGIKKKVKVDRTLRPLSEMVDKSEKCTRQVIGYLSSGGYVLGSGNCAGVGFVSVKGLRDLLEGPKPGLGVVVLVRNTTSQQYRFAKLGIIE